VGEDEVDSPHAVTVLYLVQLQTLTPFVNPGFLIILGM
jgi:hypothetical protein